MIKLQNSKRQLSAAALVLSMISISSGASLAKLMFETFTPQDVTVLRITVSAVILCLGLRAWDVRLSRQNLPAIISYGVTLAGMNLFFYLAIQTVQVAVVVAIEFTGPLCVAVMHSRNRVDFLWILLAAMGIYQLTPFSQTMSHSDLTGIMYALLAAFFWGAYIITGKKAGEHFGGKTPALGLVVASVFLMPVGGDSFTSITFNGDVITLILAMAFLASTCPLVLEMYALRNLPLKTYGIFSSCEPVVGAVISFIILNEQLSSSQLVGVGLIVLASIGSVLSIPSVQRTTEVV